MNRSFIYLNECVHGAVLEKNYKQQILVYVDPSTED